MEPNLSNELYHYGVLGMKWGVRKDPDRAYRKSVTKLTSLDDKFRNSQLTAAKKDAETAKKYDKKSAKYNAKSAKVGVRDSKAEMKAKKLRMKAPRSWTGAGYIRKIRKAETLEYKSAKKEFKASKYKAKAEKAAKKAAKLRSGSAGATLRSLKYSKKARKWASKMNETFYNVKLSDISAKDIQIGETYGVTFISEYMKT